MKINNYEEMKVWQDSIALVKEIYKVTQNQNFSKDFGLSNQLRRAAVSISSNIAEGYERDGINEFIRFLRISKGSAGEVRTQIIIARELEYIGSEEYEKINEKLIAISKQLSKFISYLKTKRMDKQFLQK